MYCLFIYFFTCFFYLSQESNRWTSVKMFGKCPQCEWEQVNKFWEWSDKKCASTHQPAVCHLGLLPSQRAKTLLSSRSSPATVGSYMYSKLITYVRISQHSDSMNTELNLIEKLLHNTLMLPNKAVLGQNSAKGKSKTSCLVSSV